MAKEMKKDQAHAMRHSLAHIMAASIQKLWPQAKFGVGPVIENGFYYDVDLGEATLTLEDLPRIEYEMQKLIKADLPFEQFELDLADAIKREKKAGQKYKQELLEDLKKKGTTTIKDLDENTLDPDVVDKVSYYRLGEFEDLCRGPHMASSGQVGAFKLHKLAGAYWRGDETRPMLQRVYGVAFKSEKELNEHLKNLEIAKQNDHRKLGQELDLFVFSDLVGPGLPLFTPRGATIRRLLSELMRQVGSKYGAQEVDIPHIAKKELYEMSGHAQKFSEELFDVKSHYDVDFVLKPVNCPHHIQIYAARPRSYKDLPIHYMQTTMQYRDEKPGQIGGLQRVRAITVDDGHIFATMQDVKKTLKDFCKVIEEVHTAVGMYGDHWVSLSLQDPDDLDKYIGEASDWQLAEDTLKEVAEELKLKVTPILGEAALYGPKLDFMYKTVTGTEIQLATIQLDFATPKRFDLEYVAKDGSKQTPVMIHRAILGSIERFMVVLLEKTGGQFPFWLAPEQVRVLTINDEVKGYVERITSELTDTVLQKPVKYNEVRFTTDDRNESLGKKIRQAELDKVPVILIVGPKDEADGVVSVRTNDGEEKIELKDLGEFLKQV